MAQAEKAESEESPAHHDSQKKAGFENRPVKDHSPQDEEGQAGGDLEVISPRQPYGRPPLSGPAFFMSLSLCAKARR